MMQLDDIRLRPVPPDFMFDAEQLAIGQKVELEHTEDVEAAKIIAKHHLLEDRDYYRKLRTIHLDGDLMATPCIYCAPSIQVSGLDGALGSSLHVETVDGVPMLIGGLAAVGGLVAAFTGHDTVAKVGAGVGLLGAVTMIGVIAYRAMRAEALIDGAAPPVPVTELSTWAKRQTSATFTSALVASGIMATSAVALLLAGR